MKSIALFFVTLALIACDSHAFGYDRNIGTSPHNPSAPEAEVCVQDQSPARDLTEAQWSQLEQKFESAIPYFNMTFMEQILANPVGWLKDITATYRKQFLLDTIPELGGTPLNICAVILVRGIYLQTIIPVNALCLRRNVSDTQLLNQRDRAFRLGENLTPEQIAKLQLIKDTVIVYDYEKGPPPPKVSPKDRFKRFIKRLDPVWIYDLIQGLGIFSVNG